jgi:hypothetical protein
MIVTVLDSIPVSCVGFSSASKHHQPKLLIHHGRSEKYLGSKLQFPKHVLTYSLLNPQDPFPRTTLNPFPRTGSLRLQPASITLRGRQKLNRQLLLTIRLSVSMRLSFSMPHCLSTVTWSKQCSRCHPYMRSRTPRCQVSTLVRLSPVLPITSMLSFS